MEVQNFLLLISIIIVFLDLIRLIDTINIPKKCIDLISEKLNNNKIKDVEILNFLAYYYSDLIKSEKSNEYIEKYKNDIEQIFEGKKRNFKYLALDISKNIKKGVLPNLQTEGVFFVIVNKIVLAFEIFVDLLLFLIIISHLKEIAELNEISHVIIGIFLISLGLFRYIKPYPYLKYILNNLTFGIILTIRTPKIANVNVDFSTLHTLLEQNILSNVETFQMDKNETVEQIVDKKYYTKADIEESIAINDEDEKNNESEIKNENSIVDLANCTKEEIQSLNGFNAEKSKRFIEERNNGKRWYDIDSLAQDFELQPHEMILIQDRIKFPDKPKSRYGRKIDI